MDFANSSFVLQPLLRPATENVSRFPKNPLLDSGSWVSFELPGFTTAASGTEQRPDAVNRYQAVYVDFSLVEFWTIQQDS
jgi:hypothetical protein